MAEIGFVPSCRGGRLLLLQQHLLSINRRKDEHTYWRCKVVGCRMTAVTSNDVLVSSNGEHNHPPDAGKVKQKVAIHKAKQEAISQPQKSMKRVFADAFGNENNEELMDHLPSFKRYRDTLYRARSQRLPHVPHNRQDIVLEGEWAETVDGRNFLLADDGIDNRIIIFGTMQNLRYMCQADTIYMDGTFKLSPEMFLQIYSIHIEVMGTSIPVCVGLLPNKTQATYSRFLALLVTKAAQIGLVFSPQIVCIDFEMAMLRTLQRLFPNSRIRGCLFHYSQAIWRKVQSLGLTARYSDDDAFNRLVRRASALPLVPPQQVDDVWLQAMNEVDDDDDAQQFMDYVTTNWVDAFTATFPMEIWNQYDNIEGHRTNNHLESWHSVMNRQLNRPHPNIFALVELLKTEQQSNEQRLRLLQAGDAAPRQRPIHIRITERLVRLRQRLINGDIDVYHYAGAVAGVLKQQVVRR